MTKLSYQHVSKRYPGAARTGTPVAAVDDISLDVAEGRLVVFLGPSGCGKTTLLKMTNRLIEPDGGTIYLDGADVRAMPVTQLRRRIGYVIQQVGLFPHMTVAANVAVVPELLGWPRQRINERVDELLDLIHLPPAEYRQRYPAQLSGGQQQRVGLARALAGDPELLLMDEPFGAIDAITRAGLQNEILDLQRRLRKTVLFVTHDVDEALRLADLLVVLRGGRLVQAGPPCQLLSQPADDFVRRLLGADDRIRQLSLLRVEQIMSVVKGPPITGPGAGQVSPQASLRDALSLFLQPGVETLAVVAEGRQVGELTLAQLRAAGCAGSVEAAGEPAAGEPAAQKPAAQESLP